MAVMACSRHSFPTILAQVLWNTKYLERIFMLEQPNTPITPPESITEDQAKQGLQSLNLINGFLFDSVIENIDNAKVVIGYILSTIYDRKVEVEDVTSQKVFQAIDTKYHSIRLDAFVKASQDTSKLTASVYDVEMEDRKTDRPALPKRLRYYSALHDTKFLGASTDYRALPRYVSITISSYDPFDAGDMYYEAKTLLTTHPQIDYEDDITHIFLYCKGKPNLKKATHSKKIVEMLQYILSGEKPTTPNADIDDIDDIVSKVKALPEVAKKYMQQWDREQTLQREAYGNGESQGVKNTNELYSWLKANARQDEVLKAVDDQDFLDKLFKEYAEWKKSNSNNS